MNHDRAFDCIKQGDWRGFYRTYTWLKLKQEVIALDRGECAACKDKGFYTRATDVHHIKKVRDHPELALSIYYIDTDGRAKRNLISLCKDCHLAADGQTRATGDCGRTQYPERW